MTNDRLNIPDGWRLLGDNEEIKPGDRYKTFDMEFKPCFSHRDWDNVRTSIGLTSYSYSINQFNGGKIRFKVIRKEKLPIVKPLFIPEPIIGVDNINISFELNE